MTVGKIMKRKCCVLSEQRQSKEIKNLADFLPDFVASFLLLETQRVVTVVTFRPDYQRLLHVHDTSIISSVPAQMHR